MDDCWIPECPDAKVRANSEIALLVHFFIKDSDPMPAAKIGGFQFRDIRPKAGSEIVDIGGASLLLGHTKQEITKRVYRRVGVTAEPSKIGEVSEIVP